MRLGSMVRAWMLPAGVVWGVLAATVALAQDQPQYETPKYQLRPPTVVDKNYGLPSFGMQGAELPKQKTLETLRPPEPSVVPDFFAGTTEIAVPKAQGPANAETPLYTTSEGSTMVNASAVPDDSDTSSDDTTEARKVEQR